MACGHPESKDSGLRAAGLRTHAATVIRVVARRLQPPGAASADAAWTTSVGALMSEVVTGGREPPGYCGRRRGGWSGRGERVRPASPPRSRCRGGHHVTGSRSGVLSHSSHPGDQQSVCHIPLAAIRTPKCFTARHLWSIASTPAVGCLTEGPPEMSTWRRNCGVRSKTQPSGRFSCRRLCFRPDPSDWARGRRRGPRVIQDG